MQEIANRQLRKQARRQVTGWFPRLKTSKILKITSHPTIDYNCHAWALGFTDRWVEPRRAAGYFWPRHLSEDPSLHGYLEMYRHHGFVQTSGESFAGEGAKIAIYGTRDEVQHSARHYAPGIWHSKLGDSWDILHELNELEGDLYGGFLCLVERSILAAR